MARSEDIEEAAGGPATTGSAPGPKPPTGGAPAARQPPHKRIFFGWYVALSGAVTNFFVLGIILHGFGVIYVPIHEELGWSMAAIAAGVSIRSFEQGFMAPLTGYMADRIGPRIMAFSGVTILTIGIFMFARAETLWFYYLASVVTSFGQSVGAMTPFQMAVMNWFNKKRGMALGLLNTGNGLAYLAAPIIALLISAYGWRTALVIGAITLWVICAPLSLLAYRRPEQRGYHTDGEEWPEDAATPISSQAAVAEETLGMTVSEAIRTPTFYLLSLANAVGGACLGTQATLGVSHLLNVGYSTTFAAGIVGAYGVIQLSLRLFLGWMGDRMGRRRVLMASYGLIGVGMIAFANLDASQPWRLALYLLIFAPGQAAWVVLSNAATADYFGVRRFATLRGLTNLLTMPIGLTAPIFAGWMFDTTGTYRVAFMLYAGFAVLGIVCFYFIRRPMWREIQAERAAEAAR